MDATEARLKEKDLTVDVPKPTIRKDFRGAPPEEKITVRVRELGEMEHYCALADEKLLSDWHTYNCNPTGE